MSEQLSLCASLRTRFLRSLSSETLLGLRLPLLPFVYYNENLHGLPLVRHSCRLCRVNLLRPRLKGKNGAKIQAAGFYSMKKALVKSLGSTFSKWRFETSKPVPMRVGSEKRQVYWTQEVSKLALFSLKWC